MTKSHSRTQTEAETRGHGWNGGDFHETRSDRGATWAGGREQEMGATRGREPDVGATRGRGQEVGAKYGGCSEAADALPERGYTIHVVSRPELRGLL